DPLNPSSSLPPRRLPARPALKEEPAGATPAGPVTFKQNLRVLPPAALTLRPIRLPVPQRARPRLGLAPPAARLETARLKTTLLASRRRRVFSHTPRRVHGDALFSVRTRRRPVRRNVCRAMAAARLCRRMGRLVARGVRYVRAR